VGAVRAEMESTGQIDQLAETVGKDRKARPSKRKRPPTEHARKAAVPKPLPTETVVREVVAPDEELDLLREFARFVIGRARVSTHPKDHPEWMVLLDHVKQVLGSPLHPPDGPGEMPLREAAVALKEQASRPQDDGLDIPDYLRRTARQANRRASI